MSELAALHGCAFGSAPDEARVVARFRADLERLCDPDVDPVLVAVSGGPDSLALLLLARAALGASLHAATVDHGLREGAAAEASMVAEVCGRLGVPHAMLGGSLPPRAGRTANLSARARGLRYRLLEDHRLATGCARVATAHHADDQAETMVMRLNRGAGVGGLAGVRERAGRVIRPLLGWRRAELEAVVSAAGFEPANDPSNVDDRFDRARLRKSLARADWLDVGRWGRSALALAEAEEALAWMTRRIADERIQSGEGRVTLTLEGEPPEIVRRLLIESLWRLKPQAEVRGGDVARLAARLCEPSDGGATRTGTLAGVRVDSRLELGSGRVDFTFAPPRRHVSP